MQSTSASPLVEPDVRISRIRLSRKHSLPSRTRRQPLSGAAQLGSQMRTVSQRQRRVFRRRASAQAEFPPSYPGTSTFRPLRSAVVTRFFATMSLSDSPSGPFPRLLIPSGRGTRLPCPALRGLPGSSAVLSLRAVPYHPGRLDGCCRSLLPRR